MRSIHARRERGVSNAQMLQQELIEALNELEQCVADGHEQIQSEKQRQQRMHDENAKLLDENVETIKTRYNAMLEALMERETRALRAEENLCECAEQEAVAEHALVSFVTALQSANPSTLAFQILPDHSVDSKYITSHFQSRRHDQGDASDNSDHKTGHLPVKLLQIIRYFHHDLTSAFENPMATHGAQLSEGAELYLYLVASDRDELNRWLQYGVAHRDKSLGPLQTRDLERDSGEDDNDGVDDWLFLFSNPSQALSFYEGARSGHCLQEFGCESEDDVDVVVQDPSDTMEPRIETFQLLLCRVQMPQTIELFYADKRDLDSLQALHAVATPRGSILQPPPLAFLQLELGRSSDARGRGGHVYMIRKAKIGDNVLPQFVLLASKRLPPPADESPEELNDAGSDNDAKTGGDGENAADLDLGSSRPSASGILAWFHRTLDAEVAAFHARLFDEVDPAQVRFRSQLLEQKKSLDDHLKHQRVHIEHEKKLQDQLVRSLQFEHQSTRRR